MTSRFTKLQKPLFIGMWLLLALDGSILVANRYLRNRLFHEPSQVGLDVAAQIRFPDLVGYEGEPMKASQLETEPSRRLVVRYAARDCEFCNQDEPLWQRLAAESRRRNFRIGVLDTAAKSAFASTSGSLAGGRQFALLRLDWIQHLKLRKTPTVLVFNDDGLLVWAHAGVLTDADCSSALTAVEK